MRGSVISTDNGKNLAEGVLWPSPRTTEVVRTRSSNPYTGHGWRPLVSDPCVFTLHDRRGDLVGISGIHVDDFLIGGCEENEVFQKALADLTAAYRWGKWETDMCKFTFAGSNIQQMADRSIRIDQNEYSEKYLDEIDLSPSRAKELKLPATAVEISQLRGLIGSIAWRSSQSSPQYQADVGLLLFEVPYANVGTLVKANKLAREVKRVNQSLLFPSLGEETGKT